MTQAAYDALPPFFRRFPKDVLERQYARNAVSLRALFEKAERTGRKVNGYTAAQLLEKAEEFHALSHAS